MRACVFLIFLFPMWVIAQKQAEKPVWVQFTDGTSASVWGLTAEADLVNEHSIITDAAYKIIKISHIGEVIRKDFGQFPEGFAHQAKTKYGILLEHQVYYDYLEYQSSNFKCVCEHTVFGIFFHKTTSINITNSFNSPSKANRWHNSQWVDKIRDPNRSSPLHLCVVALRSRRCKHQTIHRV